MDAYDTNVGCIRWQAVARAWLLVAALGFLVGGLVGQNVAAAIWVAVVLSLPFLTLFAVLGAVWAILLAIRYVD